MPLYRQTDNGDFIEVNRLIRGRPECELVLTTLEKEGLISGIFRHIEEEIADVKIFSVATKFGRDRKRWANNSLEFLYTAAGENEELAAEVLGILIYQYLTKDTEQKWLCTKAPMKSRELPTMTYWINESYDATKYKFCNSIRIIDANIHRKVKSATGKRKKAA